MCHDRKRFLIAFCRNELWCYFRNDELWAEICQWCTSKVLLLNWIPLASKPFDAPCSHCIIHMKPSNKIAKLTLFDDHKTQLSRYHLTHMHFPGSESNTNIHSLHLYGIFTVHLKFTAWAKFWLQLCLHFYSQALKIARIYQHVKHSVNSVYAQMIFQCISFVYLPMISCHKPITSQTWMPQAGLSDIHLCTWHESKSKLICTRFVLFVFCLNMAYCSHPR